MTRLTRFMWLVLFLGLGIYLALTLWLGFLGLGYPYQLDYGEGIVLWFARELAYGHSIYGLPGLSYASSNYPPVAMLLAAALFPVFGDGYTAGRLLNFASALVVAALVYRIVRSETASRNQGDTRPSSNSASSVPDGSSLASVFPGPGATGWIAALTAALFFIGSPYVYHWVPLFRTDLIGLGFAFSGLYYVWRWEKLLDRVASTRAGVSPTGGTSVTLSWNLVAAALLFLLALFTKQSLIAAPAAAFVAISIRDRRTGLAFALAVGAVGGVAYLALDAVTQGGFTFGLITSNATTFLPGQLASLVLNFVTTFPILLLLALAGWILRVRARRVGVLEWYAATAFAMLILAGRVGAWENYFFEALASTCVFAGIALGRLLEIQPFDSRLARGAKRGSLALAVALLVQVALFWHDPAIAANLVGQRAAANAEVAALIERTDGPIISEDMGALVTSGKPVVYYTFQYSSLARSGKWDQGWELNGLRSGSFPLVILESGTREDVDHYRRFTHEFVSALDRYYALVRQIGGYEIYGPAPPLNLQTASFGAIGMVGWNVEPYSSESGGVPVTIVWQSDRLMDRGYTAFVQLERADGSKVSQADSPPHDGAYPTTRWTQGEYVRERYLLRLPGPLPVGDYSLRVGWYEPATGDRLVVPGSRDDSVILQTSDLGRP